MSTSPTIATTIRAPVIPKPPSRPRPYTVGRDPDPRLDLPALGLGLALDLAPFVGAAPHRLDVGAGLLRDLVGAEPSAALVQHRNDLHAAGRHGLRRAGRPGLLGVNAGDGEQRESDHNA